jgi:hypothetical protein
VAYRLLGADTTSAFAYFANFCLNSFFAFLLSVGHLIQKRAKEFEQKETAQQNRSQTLKRTTANRHESEIYLRAFVSIRGSEILGKNARFPTIAVHTFFRTAQEREGWH